MESVNQNTGLNTLKIPYAVATICQMYLEQLEVCFNHIFDFAEGNFQTKLGIWYGAQVESLIYDEGASRYVILVF